MPADAAEARNALRAFIQRETDRLHAKAETHRRRERVKAAEPATSSGLTKPPRASASGDSRSPAAEATTALSTRF